MSYQIKENNNIDLLSEEVICELREAFNIFDIDSDGCIEISQLGMLMNALKQYPTKEELDQITKEIDADNTNQIYFNQFLKIMTKRIKNTKDDDNKYLENLFQKLDTNESGLISIKDIRYIITNSNEKISEKDIEIIMKEVDTDKDGYISLEEFMAIMEN